MKRERMEGWNTPPLSLTQGSSSQVWDGDGSVDPPEQSQSCFLSGRVSRVKRAPVALELKQFDSGIMNLTESLLR